VEVGERITRATERARQGGIDTVYIGRKRGRERERESEVTYTTSGVIYSWCEGEVDEVCSRKVETT